VESDNPPSTSRRRVTPLQVRPRPQPPQKKVLLAGVAVVAALFVIISVVSSTTFTSVPNDKIGVHYSGGPIQGSHFVELVAPGTGSRYYGQFEHVYLLPATQRNYIVSRHADIGDRHKADEVIGVSAPPNSVQISFEAAAYFKLNTEPQAVKKFFNDICLRNKCWELDTGGGWDKMLDQFLRPVLENAVRREAGKYDKDQIRSDPTVLVKMQTAIGANLRTELKEVIGGEYFCGPDATPGNCTNITFILKDPLLPEAVEKAYGDTAAAAQRVNAAQQEAAAKVAAAKGDADAQRERANAPALTDAQLRYIEAQAQMACASNPNCTMIVGGNPNVNVNANGATPAK
jgi:regulator of protease activity HflC (stomatin/prohibitin superfamily)